MKAEESRISVPDRRRFRQAMEIYMELKEHTPVENTEQRADLYYNIASLYAMDYAYEQAAEYYYKAYKKAQTTGADTPYVHSGES